jgi:hypothetical protein
MFPTGDFMDDRISTPEENKQIAPTNNNVSSNRTNKQLLFYFFKKCYTIIAVVFLTYKLFSYGCNYIGVGELHAVAYITTHIMIALILWIPPGLILKILPKRLSDGKFGEIFSGIFFCGIVIYTLIALVGDFYNEAQTQTYELFSVFGKNF